MSIRNGEVFRGDQKTVTGSLDAFFDSKHLFIDSGIRARGLPESTASRRWTFPG